MEDETRCKVRKKERKKEETASHDIERGLSVQRPRDRTNHHQRQVKVNVLVPIYRLHHSTKILVMVL